MKRALIFLILLSSFLFATDSLKVVTFNLEGMKPGTHPQERLLHIIKNLKTIDADVIGLQEIDATPGAWPDDNQARQITDSLSAFFGHPYYSHMSTTHLAWDNRFREYVGIISKYQIIEKGFQSLPPGMFPRKVVWCFIDTPLGKVHFFNTHLSFNSSTARLQQTETIKKYIAMKETKYPSGATILTGDFNDMPDSPALHVLTTGPSSLIDVFAQTHPNQNGHTIPSDAPRDRIDFILYRSLKSLHLIQTQRVMGKPYKNGAYCSDHFGVEAVFILNGTKLDGEANSRKENIKAQNL